MKKITIADITVELIKIGKQYLILCYCEHNSEVMDYQMVFSSYEEALEQYVHQIEALAKSVDKVAINAYNTLEKIEASIKKTNY